ncbi:hypothetical protein [Flavivirga rizhaonensis]|uniref:Uncharacterized protein n=1 Tax=Flavivirga rizhaonensis TaxID=2559571 RepID=A0A4V3P526_9FLAO|nr:hypothetical protein [Flavivirga rizhaonensis]TGV03644.1 hypothetical protein EM932_06360 [Flavivirga rizhaonensis]
MGHIAGYQSDITNGDGNTEEILFILPEHIHPGIFYTPGRNVYTSINKNLIVCKDIRLKKTSGPGEFSNWLLNLPKPLYQAGLSSPGTLLSLQGESFFYSMDLEGRVTIQGALIDPNDEIIFNINPYLAELPLQFSSSPNIS